MWAREWVASAEGFWNAPHRWLVLSVASALAHLSRVQNQMFFSACGSIVSVCVLSVLMVARALTAAPRNLRPGGFMSVCGGGWDRVGGGWWWLLVAGVGVVVRGGRVSEFSVIIGDYCHAREAGGRIMLRGAKNLSRGAKMLSGEQFLDHFWG